MAKKAGIYTRKGDTGKTSLAGQLQVSKTHQRINALGSLDEMNASIGVLTTYCPLSPDSKFYLSLQSDIFIIGAIVGGTKNISLDQDRIAFIEEMIDLVSAELAPLNNFILPGGSPESAWLHWVRSLCRKAERDCVLVQEMEDNLDPNVLVYLNRLSDLLFVLARKHNDKGKNDRLWRKEDALAGE